MNTMNVADVLHDDRPLKAWTGLGRDPFETRLKELSSGLNDNQPKNRRKKLKKPRQRKPGGGRQSALGSPEHQVRFILFYLKNYPTFAVLAYPVGISRGGACASVQRLLPLLKQAQKKLRVLPKRTTDDSKELLQLIESIDHIVIDATERPLQRPPKPARQTKHYRGTKGYHTVKNTTISDTDQRIWILGETVPGSQQDDTVFKAALDPTVDGFAWTEASVDLGYPGIKTD